MELFCTATKSVFSILRAFLGIDLVFCIIKTVNVSAVASAVVVVVVDDDVEACSSAATTSATISAFIVSIITVTAVITRDVVF